MPTLEERGIECNNPPCNCLIPGSAVSGEAYCGDYCRNAMEQSLESESCGCGHPPCDVP